MCKWPNMYYSFWYNRCCIDSVIAVTISENDPPEYADLIRYFSPDSSIVDLNCSEDGMKCLSENESMQMYRCSCATCKGETVAVVINVSERNLETAINMNPMFMHVIRLNTVPKTYNVLYTFIVPSIYDVRVLSKIVKQIDMTHMFVSTRLHIVEDVEDTSLFKLHIYQHRTPHSSSREYIEWICEQIERVINCKPVYYSTLYVSSFKPCSYLAPQLWLNTKK